MRVLSTSKRILITGASQGIGRTAALLLARQGHTLILAARSVDKLEQVAKEIRELGGRAEVRPMDVTNDVSVQTAIAEQLQRGPIDVVVNNAGTCYQAPFLLLDSALLLQEMELNYWGAQRVVRAVLPSMIARGQGSIVNVSSLVGFVPSPTTSNYSGTKAALNAWTHALRGEVAHFGIRVTVFVAPHTQTTLGAVTEFDGVTSLPVEYTANQLCRAIDRAPRLYVGSPVYGVFVRLAGWFPVFMERQVAATVSRVLAKYEPPALRHTEVNALP